MPHKKTITAVRDLLDSLENDTPLPDRSAFDNGDILLGVWYDRISNDSVPTNSIEVVQWETQRAAFLAYLHNYLRVLTTRSSLVQERLAHKHNPHHDFQGIDLSTSQKLYLNYQQQLDTLQANLRHHTFLIEQLHDPAFELSALSSVLTDAVSRDIVGKTSQLLLALRDEDNRSAKEQQRIRTELLHQKQFLTAHLEQTVQLDSLRNDLITAKITTLQHVTLDLIHQKISILDDQLDDYLTTRISNLHHEVNVIEEYLAGLEVEMAQLPARWVSEKLIKEQVDANQRIVQELSRLVESKILSHNLELIQSAPVDRAIAPILPRKPRLLFALVVGAFVGAFGMTTFIVFRSLVTGVLATPRNVNAHGGDVAGPLTSRYYTKKRSPLPDTDLATLRRLAAALHKDDYDKQIALLLQGTGPDYSHNLATLLAKKNLQVITIPISFRDPTSADKGGLLQVLTGKVENPSIIAIDDYASIPAGGVSRYGSEYLTSDRFLSLLNTLCDEYDWILLVSDAVPTSAEATALTPLADHIAATIKEESIDTLLPLIAHETPVTFLFPEEKRK